MSGSRTHESRIYFRAEIQKYVVRFLVQMKNVEFAFEINWPLAVVTWYSTRNNTHRCTKNSHSGAKRKQIDSGNWVTWLVTCQKHKSKSITFINLDKTYYTVIWEWKFHSEMLSRIQDPAILILFIKNAQKFTKIILQLFLLTW